jgi:phosphatidate cytidylyltransferase
MKRILTAVALIPPLVFIIGFTSPFFFALVVAVAAGLALEEFFSLAKKSGIEIHRLWGQFFSFGLIGSFHLCPRSLSASFSWLMLSALVFLGLGIGRGERLHQVLPSSAVTLLGLAYIPSTIGLLVAIRSNTSLGENSKGWILFLLLAVWLGDTGAYYVGRTLGKHQLAPLISPRKTIEGAIGGLLGNAAAAVLGKKLFLPWVPMASLLILSGILGGASQVGDLAESVLKRGAGVKDSSNLLPGHGGMLDRIDGVLFAAPVLFGYTRFFLS